MVARGDLGVEMPPEKVPRDPDAGSCAPAARRANPSIVATQMLESMITDADADARRSVRCRYRDLSTAPMR